MKNSIPDEYCALPGEYAGPAAEWPSPAPERNSPQEAGLPAETKDTAIAPDRKEEKKKKSGLGQKLKTYALATVAAVTVVAAAPSPDWDVGRAQGLLWERQLAYYAESAEELEYYAENELWYTIFGKSPDGHEAEFYGRFGTSENGPTEEFRAALTVNPRLHDNPGWLPSYEYSLLLWDGPGSHDIVFTWDISLLENENQVVAAWMENGEVRQTLVEGSAENGRPQDVITIACNYDIDLDERGEPAPRVWVYGNGTDIVGVWEEDLEHGQMMVHATTEHSNDATGRGPAYLIRFTRNP